METATPAKPKAPASAAASAPTPETAPAKPLQALQGGTLKLFDYQQNRFSTVFAAGSNAEDYVGPELWAIVIADMHQFDTVSGVTGDEKSWREYLCVSAKPGRFVLLREVPIPPRDAETERRVPKGYRVRPAAPSEQNEGCMYMVDRVDHPGLDDVIAMNRHSRHQTYEEALRWLLDSAMVRASQSVRYT